MNTQELNTSGQETEYLVKTTATKNKQTNPFIFVLKILVNNLIHIQLSALIMRIVANGKKPPQLHMRIVFDLAKHFLQLSSHLSSCYLYLRAKQLPSAVPYR